MGASAGPTWVYVNDWRIVSSFLGSAMVVFGMGMLVVLEFGNDQAGTASLLLGIGTFITVFAVLLFLPRLRSRGPVSYTLVVEGTMDEVEGTVRAVLQERGWRPQTDILRSRSKRPPRTVRVDEIPSRFTLKAAPYREPRGEGSSWTEIVQTGLEKEREETARELRESIASRLAASDSSSG